MVSYVVLGLSLVFEGVSWTVAFREFNRRRGTVGFFTAVVRSKDPAIFVVLLEDTAAVIGILIALGGTVLSVWLSNPLYDGIASIGIAAVLALTAIFLARESKGLLIGESASREINRTILELARARYGTAAVQRVMTVHLSPGDVIAALMVDFADDDLASTIERNSEALERDIRQRFPAVKALFHRIRRAREQGEPETFERAFAEPVR
jgi:divalent metal cation (Fe/Co/Zn/Cd) transporter